MKISKKIAAAVIAVIMAAGLFCIPVFAETLPNGIDTEKPCSVTVHKLATEGASTVPGSGLAISDTSPYGVPLAGAGFTLYKVSSDLEMKSTTTIEEAMVGATIVEAEKITGTNGQATWQGLEQGYYVLEETTTPAGYDAMETAIITLPYGVGEEPENWNYDIHVYPKNITDTQISKSTTTTNDVAVGDTVPWKISTKIVDVLYEDGETEKIGTFKITDELDERLTYTASSAAVTAVGGSGALALAATTDYTVSVSAANLLEVALTEAGLKKVAANASTAFTVTFNTVVNAKALTGSDTITNGATAEWKNIDGQQKSFSVPTSEQPTIVLGGISILKVDSLVATKLLSGAKFEIYYLDSDSGQKVFVKNEEGTQNLSVTTNSEGVATINGLPSDITYYLVETKAPTGYVMRRNAIEVTPQATTPKSALVIKNQKIGDPPLDDDKPTFQLPLTGGAGTVLFIIIGVILMTGATLALVKTRKQKSR